MTIQHPAEGDGLSSPAPRDVQQVIATLVARDILTPAQAARAAGALSAPTQPVVPGPGRRGRASEVAGYAGAALVASAAGLYLTTSWSSLGRAGRFTLLAGIAAVLALAGAALCLGIGRAALRRDADPVRRRLVSTLWVGAAWAAGGAAFVLSLTSWDTTSAGGPLIGGTTAFAVALTGYVLVPSLLGQVAVWGAVWWLADALADLLDVQYTDAYGAALVVVGAAWAALGVRRVLRERETALALGVLMALFGAQTPLLQGTDEVAYLLTGAVAVACFAAHLRLRGWPLLAGGVAATTLVVPEALQDFTDDAMPATGLLLVAGLTLLVASAVGMRLPRRR